MLVNHVGLTVSDLSRSTAFYVDLLGLELVRRSGPDDAAWFATLTQTDQATVEAVMLGLGEARLQLVHYRDGAQAPARVSHAAAGSAHLCLNVPDLDARRERLIAAGVRAGPVVDIADTGNRSCYVYDPDGVPVELLQPAFGQRWPE